MTQTTRAEVSYPGTGNDSGASSPRPADRSIRRPVRGSSLLRVRRRESSGPRTCGERVPRVACLLRAGGFTDDSRVRTLGKKNAR